MPQLEVPVRSEQRQKSRYVWRSIVQYLTTLIAPVSKSYKQRDVVYVENVDDVERACLCVCVCMVRRHKLWRRH